MNAARSLGINNFTASPGWLLKFNRQHGIDNHHISVEAASADLDAVELFKEKLHELMENDIRSYEIYNADETGLF